MKRFYKQACHFQEVFVEVTTCCFFVHGLRNTDTSWLVNTQIVEILDKETFFPL